MGTACLLILLYLWSNPVVQGRQKENNVQPNAWMSRLSDDRAVTSLSIPGTHNSGALHEPIRGSAACQTLTIRQQLDAGVRFFDIRCRHENDQFEIYHGPVFQKLKFAQVEKTMAEFLAKHPTEVLLVSIKQESTPRNNSRSFEDTMRRHIVDAEDLYSTRNGLPRLGEVRGKIVLLRRFLAVADLGIAATNWGHNGFHQGRQLFIQDRFELPNAEAKWQVVERAFKHSIASKDEGILHLHFTSGYIKNVLGIPNIVAVSNATNKNLANYLVNNPASRLGCVVTDFATPKLSRAVYSLNFKE